MRFQVENIGSLEYGIVMVYLIWCGRLDLVIHIPPLYLPKKFLQFGHVWVTEFRDSMQHGMHAQGHNLMETGKMSLQLVSCHLINFVGLLPHLNRIIAPLALYYCQYY